MTSNHAHRRFCLGKSVSVVACLIASFITTPSMGNEFRVETSVYQGGTQTAVDRRTTLFRARLIVDLAAGDGVATDGVASAGAGDVTLVDLAKNELVLVNESRKQYSKISAEQIHQYIAAQESRFEGMSPDRRQVLGPLVRSWDAPSQTLSLRNSGLEYTAILGDPIAAEQPVAYREFADWMARFNAIGTGGLPPSARLKLNQEVAKLGLVPKEIRRTLGDKMARTTHAYHSGWRAQDARRVAEIISTYPHYEETELFDFLAVTPSVDRRR